MNEPDPSTSNTELLLKETEGSSNKQVLVVEQRDARGRIIRILPAYSGDAGLPTRTQTYERLISRVKE